MSSSSGTTPSPGPVPDDDSSPSAQGELVVTVPPDLQLQAAARLVGDQTSGDPTLAGQRFLDSAPQMGVDLSNFWCTLDPATRHVHQACLAVIGTGRTAMMFISGPDRRRGWSGTAKLKAVFGGTNTDQGHQQRIALLRHACAQIASEARLAQALLEPRETEVLRAYRDAGFDQLGDLAYMRRPLPKAGLATDIDVATLPKWPPHIRCQSLDDLQRAGVSPAGCDRLVAAALEHTYVDTLDCPELCGLRDIGDVLDSHRSVGVYDPSLWWLLFDSNAPQVPVGCLLLSVCPEHDSVELVYIGLAPPARGYGLGQTLLRHGVREAYVRALSTSASPSIRISGSGGMTCAVDMRNGPALALYKRNQFAKFGARIPVVRSLRSSPKSTERPQ